MVFKRRKTDRRAGDVDGGAGRGVRLGGSDTGSRPTGYRRNDDPFDDDETALNATDVSVDDYANLLDDGDDNPGDRRRDPLRRP